MTKRTAMKVLHPHVGWRTPAYGWMWENFDAMIIRRGYWIGLADQFTNDGILHTNKTGLKVPYSPDALRKTYARVAVDKAMTQPRKTAKSPDRALEHPAVSPAVPVIPDDADSPSGVTFTRTPGRLKP